MVSKNITRGNGQCTGIGPAPQSCVLFNISLRSMTSLDSNLQDPFIALALKFSVLNYISSAKWCTILKVNKALKCCQYQSSSFLVPMTFVDCK